jgi:hypothetical protein
MTAHGAPAVAPAFGEIDEISDDPAENHAVSHANAQFAHDPGEIPVTKFESQKPVHAADDGIVGEPSLCEQWVCELFGAEASPTIFVVQVATGRFFLTCHGDTLIQQCPSQIDLHLTRASRFQKRFRLLSLRCHLWLVASP